MKKIVAALAVTAACGLAWAHSGNTDKFGCHTDRSTGIWHCH